MLFNSYFFIFIFLPVTLFLFFSIAKLNQKVALSILLTASLLFYGWEDYHFIFLILFSIIINFIFSGYLVTSDFKYKKSGLWFGIFFNLGLLGYFKYADFFIQSINHVLNTHFALLSITLPLGISFFTFTQIAYLVDCYQEKVKHHHFLKYCLFVTYFPHLIAGPIIHHKEVMPQFDKKKVYQFSHRNFSIALTLFVIGFFKKTILADRLGLLVSPVFDLHHTHLACAEAWLSALAYSLELYFDFSGYSDMAIGLSFLIGIKLPVNFYSPYQSTNIIEFWRRWNMTLSRFLRDYLYIPLGGNRRGSTRRYCYLLITMLLGGLWHGANWTFVAWGGLHGIYLCINHAWKKIFGDYLTHFHIYKFASLILTFIAVVIGWVFFRAPDFYSALHILYAMFFENNNTFSTTIVTYKSIFLITLCLFIVWKCPNSYQILFRFRPALLFYQEKIIPKSKLSWKPNFSWNFIMVIMFIMGILHIQQSSIFLYYHF